jgi:hypothetical protein
VFIATQNGMLNSDSIATIEPHVKGGSLIKLKDGTSQIADQDPDELSRSLGPVIPEMSGTKSLSMGFDGGEFFHFTQPVLGWVIAPLGPEPIVVGGAEVDYLLFADGTVEQPHLARYYSLDEAIEAFKRDHPGKV